MAEGALSADGRVHMLGADGTPMLVDKAEIQQAYAAGMTLESPEAVEQRAIARERGTLGQQAITAVEGGARGLTLGASDVAAAAVLGDEYGQAALERQRENPITAIGSELVGGLVGAKGTGILKYSPAALAAKAGSGAARLAEGGAALAGYRGTTAAGRLAAKALSVGAAGATEGALWGAGSAASRAALEGQQITAEKLLAGAGEGAELGGLFGAGLGAGGHFLGAAARKAASVAGLEGGLGGIGARLRDRATLRATGFRRADVRKLGATTERVERRVAELADDVREYKFRGNTEASKELKGAKLWERAGKPEELAADLTIARREVGAELGSVREKIDNAIKSAPPVTNPETGEVTRALEGPDVGSLIQRVEAEVLAPMRSSLSPDVQAKAARVERSIAPLAERHAAANAGPWDPNFGSIEPVSFAELDQFRRDLRSVFQPKRPSGGGIQAPVPEHAAELEAVERMVSQTIDDSAVSTLRKMGQDPTEYLELKRQFGAMRDLESVATRAASDEAARGLTSPWERILGFGGAIGAMASGNIGALAAGIGGAAASRILQNYGDRALVKMLDTVSALDNSTATAAKALVGAEKPVKAHAVVPIVGAKAIEAYERTRDSIREIDDDPRGMMGRLTQLTDRYAVEYPGVSSAVQAQAIKQVQAIREALPPVQNRAAHSLTPQVEDPVVGVQAIQLSMRKIKGITQPGLVIQELGQGKLDLAAIEAFKENSPLLFQELRVRVMREATEAGSALPFRRRQMLGLAFDFPSDYSMTPAGAQALVGLAPPPADMGGEGGGSTGAAPDASFLTATQRLETQ
ncbi:MAG TPA: hypothetical protein VFZ21_30915 [Gemmatimonadaceae bacterium]|nr:hypothetical protein [Gemmatimonadaceae bacterium]